jgi:hypothetical protein
MSSIRKVFIALVLLSEVFYGATSFAASHEVVLSQKALQSDSTLVARHERKKVMHHKRHHKGHHRHVRRLDRGVEMNMGYGMSIDVHNFRHAGFGKKDHLFGPTANVAVGYRVNRHFATGVGYNYMTSRYSRHFIKPVYGYLEASVPVVYGVQLFGQSGLTYYNLHKSQLTDVQISGDKHDSAREVGKNFSPYAGFGLSVPVRPRVHVRLNGQYFDHIMNYFVSLRYVF